jgi:SAM-dependent methyltransferase
MSAPLEQFAQSFGSVAAIYDAHRPEYPPEALDRAVAGLGLMSQAEVVDLAAGTGKLTRPLAERFARVVAVEPDERMRARLKATTSGIEVRAGTAEHTTLPGRSADAVFVADAFHWFATDAALREIARVLKPGGGLVLLWNHWWRLEPPFPDEIRTAFDEAWHRTGRREVQGDLDAWRTAFEGSPFGDRHEAVLTREQELTAAEVAALYLTTSSIAALPDERRDELRALLERGLSGTYLMPIETTVSWTRVVR